MDCLVLRAHVERGEPLDPAAREHALSCEACGAVVLDDAAAARRLVAAAVGRAGGSASFASAASAADGSATQASLEATRRLLGGDRGLLGALRARPTWQRVAALLGLLAAALAWQLAAGAPHALLEVAPHAQLFAAACALLLWPLGQPLPRLGRAAGACLGLALPVAFALWAHARGTHPMPESSPWPCLVYGAALAAPFLAALAALDRRAALGVEQALLAGSIAGVAGNALLHLHCPSDALAHLTLGHAPLGAVAVLMALALGRIPLRRRSAA